MTAPGTQRHDTGGRPTVHILGTHGVPAAYGGFETAAQYVGLHLARQGWRVVVYCQEEGAGETTYDTWQGLERVVVREPRVGWLGTASFDLTTIRYVAAHAAPGDVCLTFGYNTGVFNLAQKLLRIPNVINMDGMEWTRRRWGVVRQGILLANERFAGAVGTTLIADHPQIALYLARHFGRRRVATITYGADQVTDAPTGPVHELGLTPGRYATLICRPIPENSITEIVTAWSRRPRGMDLVVLGTYTDDDPYHREVVAAAGAEVRFVGAIYDPDTVQALRFHGAAYLHGHTVGGTNPSLVEAMAAGNPVIAHRNRYNTWVAGDGQAYFGTVDELDSILTRVLSDDTTRQAMSNAATARFLEEFTWEHVGGQYDAVLRACLPGAGPSRWDAAVVPPVSEPLPNLTRPASPKPPQSTTPQSTRSQSNLPHSPAPAPTTESTLP